ncbi:MAG: hypothetical protein NC122_00640 [Faecalibacterium sp.]|nr:hypothetical protein [Ruminococcus sp.]MCM1484695.1 hypothetical protein [Faecalibacterium sp.]
MVAVSVLLILVSCCSPLLISAVDYKDADTTISLPFPNPNSFGSYSSAVVVYTPETTQGPLFEMFVTHIVPYGGYDINSIRTKFRFHSADGNNADQLLIDFALLTSMAGTGDKYEVYIYRYAWYATQNAHYTYSLLDSRTLSDGIKSYSNLTQTRKQYAQNYINFYGNCIYSFNGFSKSYLGCKYNYVFGNEINPEDIETIVDYLGKSTVFESGIYFYTQQILSELRSINDDEFTTAEDTTNGVVNDYDNAEKEVIGDSFDNLDKAADALPDLNSFNSGNQRNAFAFISSNIEFFSGMNGSGSVSKIATVMFVILGLGLASFIVGLTNRRKE